MNPPPNDPTPPLGEEDRNAAVQRLQEAYAEGHLSHEEMDTRLDLVLAATTHGEVSTAMTSLPARKPDTTATIGAAAGRIRRRGAWHVPRTLKVESAYGNVYLDLSRAVIEHPVVDIELQLGTGKARITLPRDAVVDAEGLRTEWKDTRYTPPRRAVPGGPTVRISGSMGFGGLKIRHARR